MKLTKEQVQEIKDQQSQENITKRVTAPELEKILYEAIPILDHGFVRVVDPKTVLFPNYDGNGMFMSVGNIQAKSKVGLLFIDFQTPQRIRVRGEARCIKEGSILKSYPGANLVIELIVSNVWVNCPRYIHQMNLTEQSPYVPEKDGTIPLALWKRVDLVQDVITDEDKEKAESLGLITIEEYEANVASGKLL